MNGVRKKVFIGGGGFGGLAAAKVLGGKRNVEVTLIDRRNYHLFQPLLYQVATAGLSPAEISVPIRAEMSASRNVTVVLGNVTGVDVTGKTLIFDSRPVSFDYLILACGAKHSYFSHPDWEEFAPGLKTLEQATEIRRRILLAFELAEKEDDPEKRKPLMTFIVVGGGPTGVELAGAIAEISRHTLERDFRHIDPSSTRIILIEAGSRVLSSFSPSLSKKAARDLETLGVQLWLNTTVTQVSGDGVSLGQEFINAKTVLWAAGVEPSSLVKSLDSPMDKLGRAIVKEDLSLPEQKDIFVIGDMAAYRLPDGSFLPGLAPVAIQQGRHAARQILADLGNKPRDKFRYVDKGVMATIGRSKAVMQYGKIELSGFLAWIMWLFVHIYYLIGFKNKLFVFMQWAWSYFTLKKGARLILNKEWRTGPKDE